MASTQCTKDPVTGLWKVLPDTQISSTVTKFILESWGAGQSTYFPGPQPVSIERRHFSILKNNEYMVCEKTDGVRHVLVSLVIGDKKMCLVVNRAFDMYVAPLNLPKSAYQGTILDGELIGKNFLVYDAVIVSGASAANDNFTSRVAKAGELVKGVMKVKSDPISLKMKKFFSLRDYKTFIVEHIPTVEYAMDGVVFTPVNEPVRSGTHETLFKWKPRENNTIDFQFKRWPNKWGLYVLEKGRLVFESELAISKAPEWVTEDCIVECRYMSEDEPRWWKPLVLRSDKKHPNNRRTFYRTLVNIKEDIQIGEFGLIHRGPS
jgi:hypothetical protein